MSTLLPFIEIETHASPDASIIWLHGLGADGYDFEPIVPELKLDDLALRFIFPHAPMRPVTLNGGAQMRAWYDILGMDLQAEEDAQGIISSAVAVNELIAHEAARGIPLQRIILAGFSQGGAIALHTGIRQTEPLGGILALSTYLPLAKHLAQQQKPINHSVPILFAHGEHDPVIPMQFAKLSAELLSTAGFQIQWQAYPMAHTLCPAEIQTISQWLRDCLS